MQHTYESTQKVQASKIHAAYFHNLNTIIFLTLPRSFDYELPINSNLELFYYRKWPIKRPGRLFKKTSW